MADRHSQSGPLGHVHSRPEVDVSIAPLGLPGTLDQPRITP